MAVAFLTSLKDTRIKRETAFQISQQENVNLLNIIPTELWQLRSCI